MYPNSNLFVPDALTPDQFFDRIRNVIYAQPEKRLLLAVLSDAIHCFQAYFSANKRFQKRLYVEAEMWLFGDDPTWLFSFLNICDLLNLNADYIRKGLTQWRENMISKIEMGRSLPKRRDVIEKHTVAVLVAAYKSKLPAL